MSTDNLYLRGDIWWGCVKIAGRKHRCSLRTRDRAQAKKRVIAWRAKLIGEAHYGERRLRWKEAVTKYTTEVMPQSVKDSTATRYVVSFRMVDPHFSGLWIDEIKRRQIADMVRPKSSSVGDLDTALRANDAQHIVLAGHDPQQGAFAAAAAAHDGDEFALSNCETYSAQGLNLDIRRGETFVILGGSGCGKSTLLRLVAGLDEPTAGSLRIGDEEVPRGHGVLLSAGDLEVAGREGTRFAFLSGRPHGEPILHRGPFVD